MNTSGAEAGNKGDNVRSDCWVRLKPITTGGLNLKLTSRVEVLYGDANRKLIHDMLHFFEIMNAEVEVQDAGALPFVIMARVETAVRRLELDKGKR